MEIGICIDLSGELKLHSGDIEVERFEFVQATYGVDLAT